MGGTNLFLTAGPQQSNVDGALLLTQERPPSSSQLNLDTLSGLRGLCAVYIMIGHGLLFCTASSVLPRLFVPVQMPFFFLLSGFCLATANDRSARGGEGAHFDYWNFHWKRFARVYPTYILTNLLAVPLVFSGYTDAKPPSWPRMIPLALTCTATWGLFVHIPNVASWTICTLVFFYLLFPSLFLCLRKKSSVFLQRLEWSMDVLQFVVGMSLLHGIQWWFEKMHWHDPSKQFYWVPTTNPVSRLPIFLMGMSAGLLCSRKISSWKEATRAGEGGESGQQEEMGEEGDGATEASLPHPEGQGEAEEGSLLHGEAARAEGEKRNAATRADVWMLVWMGFFLVLCVLSTVPGPVGDFMWRMDIVGQFVVPRIQLLVIQNVALDVEQKSVTSRVMLTRGFQWLGEISMSLYLVHLMLLGWLQWAARGGASAPAECVYMSTWTVPPSSCDVFQQERLLPWTWLFLFFPLSILFGWVVTVAIEAPLRKSLSPR